MARTKTNQEMPVSIGERFGAFTVKEALEKDSHSHCRWRVECDNGHSMKLLASNLKRLSNCGRCKGICRTEVPWKPVAGRAPVPPLPVPSLADVSKSDYRRVPEYPTWAFYVGKRVVHREPMTTAERKQFRSNHVERSSNVTITSQS
jgi:hypothetical protein